MKLKILCAAAVSAAALCGSAYADGFLDSMRTDPEYSKLDKDGDGKITKSEASSNRKLVAEWTKLDTNKDGKLDKAEFAKFEATPVESDAADPADR